MQSFLKTMFETMQQLPLGDKRRDKLSVARDALTDAVSAFRAIPSPEHMVALNGAWVCAFHTHCECQPTPPTPPRAGAGEKNREQKVA